MIKFSLKQKDGSYNCGAFVVAYYKALKEKFPEGLKDRNDEHCTISIDIDINEIYDQIKFTTEDKDEIKKLLCKYAMYFEHETSLENFANEMIGKYSNYAKMLKKCKADSKKSMAEVQLIDINIKINFSYAFGIQLTQDGLHYILVIKTENGYYYANPRDGKINYESTLNSISGLLKLIIIE